MKQGFRNLLLTLLDENIDLCSLCLLDKCDKVSFEDKIAISEDISVECREMLNFIFGESTVSKLSDIGTICKECSVVAMNNYKFIREAQQTAEDISKFIEHLEVLFANIPEFDCKTLYLSLNLKPDLSSSQILDNVNVYSNINNAVQRYKELMSNQTNPEDRKKNWELGISPKNKVVSNKNKVGLKKPGVWLSSVSGRDDTVFGCSMCPETFKSAISLQTHKKNIHTKSAISLRTHKKNIHTNLMCLQCGKQFNNQQYLKMHEQRHYMKYICQECGRVYKNQTTLRHHYENNICQNETRNSPANAKFTCDYCQKKYTHKMSLRVHIQHEHLNYKSHECEWCKKKFWCQSRLKAHIVKHTRERNFVCKICGGKFVTKESLLYHTRLHTGERPYACPHCDKSFLSASRRKAHVRNQHEEPTVECDGCHSFFRSHTILFKHLRFCSEIKVAGDNLCVSLD